MFKKVQWWHLLLLIATGKIVLHLTTNGLWSLHRDALLYLALGRHLDWGFASVPPSIGFFGWVSDQILGGSPFAIRLIPTFFSTMTVLLMGLIAYEMSDKKNDRAIKIAAVLVGLAGLFSGAILRTGMMFQPVVFDLFYWALFCWLIVKYINTQQPKWFIYVGIAIGFGLLNKYSVAFFIFAMLPWFLFTSARSIILKKEFYIGILLATLIFLPNLLWQYDHQWPVIRHMQELAATQFVNVTVEGFLMDQLLFFLPAAPLWLMGLYFLLFHKDGKKWRGLGWMYFTVLMLLLFLGGKSYYTIGAYPVLIAAGSAFVGGLGTKKVWVPITLTVFLLAASIPMLPLTLPVFSPDKEAAYFAKRKDIPVIKNTLRWENGRYYALPQDFADMLGWEEIADMTGQAWQTISDKQHAAIYAENYGLAGAIEHFGKKYNVPQVLSFSDNYRYWLPDSLSPDFQTLVYVNDELGDDMPGFFAEIKQVGNLEMPLSRQDGTMVFICSGPTPAFFERMGGAIKRAKNEEVID